MKSNINKGLLFLFFIVVPLLGRAAPPEWQIDPNQSSISFTATQNDAPVTGQFKRFTGKIFVDPANYKTGSVDIVIDMSSINMSYADITNILTTSDWFDVKMFPKAAFKSTDFTKTGENTYQVNGNLTIRDKTVPTTITFTTQQPSPDVGIATGSMIVKRTAFGVGQGEWADTNEIKNDVKIDFKIVAKKQP